MYLRVTKTLQLSPPESWLTQHSSLQGPCSRSQQKAGNCAKIISPRAGNCRSGHTIFLLSVRITYCEGEGIWMGGMPPTQRNRLCASLRNRFRPARLAAWRVMTCSRHTVSRDLTLLSNDFYRYSGCAVESEAALHLMFLKNGRLARRSP